MSHAPDLRATIEKSVVRLLKALSLGRMLFLESDVPFASRKVTGEEAPETAAADSSLLPPHRGSVVLRSKDLSDCHLLRRQTAVRRVSREGQGREAGADGMPTGEERRATRSAARLGREKNEGPKDKRTAV